MSKWNAKPAAATEGDQMRGQGLSRQGASMGKHIKELLDGARQFMKDKRFDEAKMAFENVLENNAEAVSAYIGLANVYAAKGEYENVLEYCAGALHIKRDLPMAHMLSGDAYLAMGELDKSLEKYRELLEINPNLDRAYLKLATIYARQNRLVQAIDMANEALRHNPQSENGRLALAGLLRQDGKVDLALKELESVIAQYPQSWRAQLKLAQYLISQKEYKEAVRVCKIALDLKEDMNLANYLLGRAYMGLGENELALKEFAIVMERNPRMVLAKTGTARIFLNQGKLIEAKELLNSLTEGESQLGLVHLMLAEVMMLEFHYELAVAQYQAVLLHSAQLLEKHPELAEVKVNKDDYKVTAERYKELFSSVGVDPISDFN